MAGAPDITAFFDEATNSVSYLVADPATRAAVVVDPVLDFDPASGIVSTGSADAILQRASDQGLAIEWVLETHAHADHLSAASYLKSKAGAQTAVGRGILDVQRTFAPIVDAADVQPDGG